MLFSKPDFPDGNRGDSDIRAGFALPSPQAMGLKSTLLPCPCTALLSAPLVILYCPGQDRTFLMQEGVL